MADADRIRTICAWYLLYQSLPHHCTLCRVRQHVKVMGSCSEALDSVSSFFAGIRAEPPPNVRFIISFCPNEVCVMPGDAIYPSSLGLPCAKGMLTGARKEQLYSTAGLSLVRSSQVLAAAERVAKSAAERKLRHEAEAAAAARAQKSSRRGRKGTRARSGWGCGGGRGAGSDPATTREGEDIPETTR